jgi:hypothetical protein
MKINEHTLIHAQDAGNGFHGSCKYCGLALVTDLGYCSWDNTVCIDRETHGWATIPNQIKNFAQFKGLVYIEQSHVFVRPYFDESYTIDQLNTIITQL